MCYAARLFKVVGIMEDERFYLLLQRLTGITDIKATRKLQSLWSGYGQILRVHPRDAQARPVIVKYIALPENQRHPRGWNTDLSHQRKLRSYEVERHWYQHWSAQCDSNCRVAHCYGSESLDGAQLIVMEDMDNAGYAGRFHALDKQGAYLCLHWLACFHAKFLSAEPQGLWPVGTYWHLQTRPDEFAVMAEGEIKHYAGEFDRLLNECRFQTLVHGDAKVANFCFSEDLDAVAAVDFQYVGGGCGIKDVIYFMGSCLDEHLCAQWQDELLDYYFSVLKQALLEYGCNTEWSALEREWRDLYAIAWTDFYRFLLGWMPKHTKIHGYTKRLATEALIRVKSC